MSIRTSADHWTINVKYDLSEKMEKEMVGKFSERTAEQRKEGREKYKAWRKEMRSRIPKRNEQTIYYKSIEDAKKAFEKAGLKETEYEINCGFFMGF